MSKKINWNWFFKKYWKKILISILLSTISTVSFLLLIRNGAEKIYSYLKENSESNPKFFFYSLGGKTWLNFGENWKSYLLFVIVFAIISCLLTAFSICVRLHIKGLPKIIQNGLDLRVVWRVFCAAGIGSFGNFGTALRSGGFSDYD